MARRSARKRFPHDKSRAARKRSQTIEAEVHVVRPGYAYALTQEGRFAFTPKGLREAMDGDRVLVSVVHPKGGEPQVVTQHVVSRAVQTLVGVYEVAGPLGVVVSLDERLRRDFFVLPQDSSAARLGVEPGCVVRARILSYPSRAEAGIVTLEENLGSSAELDLPLESLIASFGLAQKFPQPVLDEASGFTLDVEGALAADPKRRDLRNVMCVTIDPADARDFDDAISCRRLPNGGFELGVHIADVSHYVQPQNHCDLEARQRTTSVYLVDRVLPMLPEAISNELCSLKPQEDRLAVSVTMQLNAQGEVVSWKVAPSAIHSHARLTYDAVDAYLTSGNAGALKPAVFEQDLPTVRELIAAAHELEGLRHKIRQRRGAIDFDSAEVRMLLDDKGVPQGVSVRRKTAATSLVEEAMLLANECVAHQLAQAGIETAFRVHEPPAAEHLEAALIILGELGVAKGQLAARIATADPFAMQEVLAKVAGTPNQALVDSALLRAQARANYRPQNLGHFALAAEAYCHFTSPIRRYPDVLVHRAIKALVTGRPQPNERQGLSTLLGHCSERERAAEAASRDSHKIKMAEFYEARVGQDEFGLVSRVTERGMFVTLNETFASVFVSMRQLGAGWVHFDEKHLQLTDTATGSTWRPGKPVHVRISKVNRARGHIDAELL